MLTIHVRLKISCDYDLYLSEHGNATSSLPSFLFSHYPVALGQTWLPVAFDALQPYRDNFQGRRIDIDKFVVQLIMTSLAEGRVHVQDVLSAYFRSVQSWLPVIHEKRFRSRITQLRHAPAADTVLLLCCMSLVVPGWEDCPDDGGARNQAYYICKYLFSFLQLVQPPSLEMVQCGLLITVFEVGAALSAAASVSIGTCARLGYALDLHVDQRENYKCSSPAWIAAEEQRRVWLGLFMLDR